VPGALPTVPLGDAKVAHADACRVGFRRDDAMPSTGFLAQSVKNLR